MAVNIKDLYGNPGYRFKKYSQKFSIKEPYLIYIAVWSVSEAGPQFVSPMKQQNMIEREPCTNPLRHNVR